MSSNLLKYGYNYIPLDDTRIIDSNAAVEQKISTLLSPREETALPDEDGETAEFTGGLHAKEVDMLFEPTGEETATVLKAPVEEGPDAEELIAEAQQEIERMQREAEAALQAEREEVLRDARNQGYQEGLEKGRKEAESLKQQLLQKEKQLEKDYEERLNALEPEMISALTDVYEHIFQVELSSYRQIITTLISNALHQIEGGRNYIIHISPADYPYVSLQKAQITANCPASTNMEFAEDATLRQNECLIETENGIFDCGLGTQLEELKRKLRLLSFER